MRRDCPASSRVLFTCGPAVGEGGQRCPPSPTPVLTVVTNCYVHALGRHSVPLAFILINLRFQRPCRASCFLPHRWLLLSPCRSCEADICYVLCISIWPPCASHSSPWMLWTWSVAFGSPGPSASLSPVLPRTTAWPTQVLPWPSCWVPPLTGPQQQAS